MILAVVLATAGFYLKFFTPEQISQIQVPALPFISGPAQTVKLSLTTLNPKPKVGEQIVVNLEFQSPTPNIISFDAVVSYDPEVLRVNEINPKTMFSLYPRKLIEDDKKRFIVTGIQTDLKQALPFVSGPLAEVLVTPLKSGKTKLEFLVEGAKYTSMLNSKAENILGKTEGLEIEVGD